MAVNVSTAREGVAKGVYGTESETRAPRTSSLQRIEPSPTKSYVCEKDGVRYAGTHLLIDLRGGRNYGDPDAIETALRESVAACGATLLDLKLHQFSPHSGVSGVAVLAESHMSIHTWPELEYAAVDLFMCGGSDPYRAMPVLRRLFEPHFVHITEQKRGFIG